MSQMCVICLLLFCHLALPNVKLVRTHTNAVLAILAAFTVMDHVGHTAFIDSEQDFLSPIICRLRIYTHAKQQGMHQHTGYDSCA